MMLTPDVSPNGIVPVILCGGGGTRLWPRSRPARPKPFLPLVGESSLFQAALDRCAQGKGFAPPLVVTGADHVDLVAAQLSGDGARVIVEPEGKNTAAAIALAALRLPSDTVMLVCPSDHHIGDGQAFAHAALAAAGLAREGWLVAFGIEARAPETGYGYLKRGEAIYLGGHRVEQFIEKPNAVRAVTFLRDGGYAWNGGIFAFTAGDYLEELAVHRPHLADAARRAVIGGQAERELFYPDAVAFAEIEAESVDYAVMEHTRRAAMVPVDMDWSDIGTWPALHAARGKDAHGNCITGPAELLDCHDVLVDTDGPRVSVVGLTGVAIIIDGDDVLVTSADAAQQVGKLRGAREG